MNIPSKNSLITFAVLFVVLVCAVWYTYTVIQSRQANNADDSPAVSALSAKPGQSGYTDINGNVVMLESYLGNVLVVTSWASWCPACAQTLPNFAELGKRYQNADVVVLAINRAEPSSTAQAFLNAINATDGLNLVLDPGDRYFKTIGGFSMPETLFYDTAGNVVFHKRGSLELEEMVVHVNDALKANPVRE